MKVFNLCKLEEAVERRLPLDGDGAESKDRVVFVPKVNECFTWGLKSDWGTLLMTGGYRVSAAQWRCLFLPSTLLPRGGHPVGARKA